ncbi:MAG: efflux RND transporter periplasmic adaptor subunit [Hyphococcus sp.]
MKTPGVIAAGAAIGLVIGIAATAIYMSTAGDEKTAAGFSQARRGGYAPAVSMALAEKASITRRIDVIGEARALKSVVITSEATGLVQEVNIAPGKRVAAGDIILRVDDEAQRIALERAQAEYPIAKENAERYRNLASDASASALELEQAINNFNRVRADLKAAQDALTERSIRAPFDGIAGLTDIEVGDYLRAGDMVTTLDDTSSIVVEFAVPQEAASFVAIGQPVTARLTSGAGLRHEGEITAIDSRVDSASRTLSIEATFPNANGRLIPGAVFAVTTASEGEPAVALPGLAIQWDRAGAYVWKRGPEGKAQRASVVILQRNDDIVLVEGDVAFGDAVVADGADRVRFGVTLPKAPGDTVSRGAAAAASAGLD